MQLFIWITFLDTHTETLVPHLSNPISVDIEQDCVIPNARTDHQSAGWQIVVVVINMKVQATRIAVVEANSLKIMKPSPLC